MRDYWHESSLHNGNYARCMIPSLGRSQALLTFLKVVDHTSEQQDYYDRLRKVRFLYDILRQKCLSLYRSGQVMSVDERMVKSKAHFAYKQYLPKKPVKWGFKIFAACAARNGMLFDFEVYTGQAEAGDDGLTHDVRCLIDRLDRQGCIFVTDNFYTSAALGETLTQHGSHLVRTMHTN